jgi:hypothetical protein
MEEEARPQDFDAIKADLRTFLQDQVGAYREHPDQSSGIAYRIAGQMSDEALRNLPPDDPYMQILALAGQLELPEAHQAEGSSWDTLIAMVDAL